MDSAFPSAPYAGYTTTELQAFIDAGRAKADAMEQEIARRARRDAGDESVMTPGERLTLVMKRNADGGTYLVRKY